MKNWSHNSKARLNTTHSLLQLLFDRVLERADLPYDLMIVCGHRSQADQEAAYVSGHSKVRWPNSKHNKTPAEAVDVVPWVGGKPSWEYGALHDVAGVVKAEWETMKLEGNVYPGIKLEWGGDWAWRDGAHWQLTGLP